MKRVLMLYVALGASVAAAENLCAPVQDCMDDAVPTAISSCLAATPACVTTNPDKFAVSAGQVAERAVKRYRCDTRTFRTKGACNLCFTLAKEPLRDRFFGKLFRGLLANAVSIIEEQRKAKCPLIGATPTPTPTATPTPDL